MPSPLSRDCCQTTNMAACFEHVQESCGSMDVKVGDLLVGKRCNWLVESLLACGTCSQVFQVRAVEETGYSAAHGCWTAALKVFRKGNNYESAAQNEVHIREDLSDGGEALADCIGKVLGAVCNVQYLTDSWLVYRLNVHRKYSRITIIFPWFPPLFNIVANYPTPRGKEPIPSPSNPQHIPPVDTDDTVGACIFKLQFTMLWWQMTLKSLKKPPFAGPFPSVLQLMDHFHHNQHVCLVYEKLAYNLHHVLLRNSNKGSLPLGIIQKLSEHLLRSLQHFARKGIVHGDVKPGNIMWNASRGVFQLIDFGLSFYEGKQVEVNVINTPIDATCWWVLDTPPWATCGASFRRLVIRYTYLLLAATDSLQPMSDPFWEAVAFLPYYM